MTFADIHDMLLLQMMYPVSEIWRPVAFAAPQPHPLLLQPLPSIRLLRSEDVAAAAAGSASTGSCDAEGSCPAPFQSRCRSLHASAWSHSCSLCMADALVTAPHQLPLALSSCHTIAHASRAQGGTPDLAATRSIKHDTPLPSSKWFHFMSLHAQPAAAPGDDLSAPQLGGAERHRAPAGLELHPPAAHRASAGAG
jgi:hypothetical protein